MPSDMAALYKASAEAQRDIARLEERFDKDPRIKALNASGRRFDRATSRAMRSSLIRRLSPESAAADSPLIAAVSFDLCTDLSLGIYAATQEYRATLADQTAALDQMLESLATGDVGGSLVAYSEWRNASIDIIFLQVELSIMASLYGAYGCWD
jgi:hypothetical protein